MNKSYVLDTGPLGMIIHPNANPEIVTWFEDLLGTDAEVYVPEISDYELRRELILQKAKPSIQRLDKLESELVYLPLRTPVMRKAAELWAQVRKAGKPTADMKALDGDVILAAQALDVSATVVTTNVEHLDRLVDARRWQDVQ